LLVARDARIASMIELGMGFHPELTGRDARVDPVREICVDHFPPEAGAYGDGAT
jgi:hypothetical protein